MSTNSTTAAARPVDLARAAESRGYEVTIANIVCAVFALVLVVLRVYTRLVVVRKRFWEDFAIVMAMVGSLPSLPCVIRAEIVMARIANAELYADSDLFHRHVGAQPAR